MKVLVTGATGYIGGRLIPLLLDRGHEVRALVRDPERLEGRSWTPRVEVAKGDVLDPESTRGALEGMDAAYYLVHSICAGPDFAEKDRRAARSFAQAGEGIGQVIYLGGIFPEGDGRRTSEHLRSRAEVGEILREALPTTEIRAGPIIGPGSASFEMVRHLTERLPVMVAPRWIRNPVQPIAVRDVLAYLAAVLGRDDALGVIDVGTNPLTFKEMMLGYAHARGLPRIIIPLPVLAPGLAALWVGLVTPIPNCLAVPLVRGMVKPVVGDLSRARRLFPDIHPLPYPFAVKLALERTFQQHVQTRWSDALGSERTFRLENQVGLVREIRSRLVGAPRERVFDTVSSIGGERGWLVWEWAWKLRGIVDQLVGGPGLRRGRRHPRELVQGDAVDFWRVEEIERPGLLRLRAEMKLPGKAWLQWETYEEDGGTRLVQSALFEPKGFWGWAYWYASYPFHAFIFDALVDALAEETLTATPPSPPPGDPGPTG